MADGDICIAEQPNALPREHGLGNGLASQKTRADHSRLEQSGITPDVTGPFQAPHAFMARCGGEVYFFRQCDIRNPPVFLQVFENQAVGAIEFS